MKQYDIPLKDYLNSINLKQGDLTEDPVAMKKYPAYVINKCMMHHIDTLMHANMTRHCLTVRTFTGPRPAVVTSRTLAPLRVDGT